MFLTYLFASAVLVVLWMVQVALLAFLFETAKKPKRIAGIFLSLAINFVLVGGYLQNVDYLPILGARDGILDHAQANSDLHATLTIVLWFMAMLSAKFVKLSKISAEVAHLAERLQQEEKARQVD